MLDRPTIRIRADLTGRGEFVIIDPDGTEHDISNMVNASVVKIEIGAINTVVMRLIGVSLDVEVEGDVDLQPVEPEPNDG